MKCELPQNWEPGQNHGWKGGHDRRSREMARALLTLMIVCGCLVLIGLSLSGCCTFWADTSFHFQQMKDGRTVRTITSAQIEKGN